MTRRSGAVLYTPEILGLAVGLSAYPLTEDLPLRGEASSRVCGSRVTMGLATDERDRIARRGARITACAIGQASAAIFLESCAGRDDAGLAASLASLELWLAQRGEAPDWPRIAMLAPALVHTARHAAILLPWKAALAALSKPVAAA